MGSPVISGRKRASTAHTLRIYFLPLRFKKKGFLPERDHWPGNEGSSRVRIGWKKAIESLRPSKINESLLGIRLRRKELSSFHETFSSISPLGCWKDRSRRNPYIPEGMTHSNFAAAAFLIPYFLLSLSLSTRENREGRGERTLFERRANFFLPPLLGWGKIDPRVTSSIQNLYGLQTKRNEKRKLCFAALHFSFFCDRGRKTKVGFAAKLLMWAFWLLRERERLFKKASGNDGNVNLLDENSVGVDVFVLF